MKKFHSRTPTPMRRLQSALDRCWNETEIEWYQPPAAIPRRCACGQQIVAFGVAHCSLSCEMTARTQARIAHN